MVISAINMRMHRCSCRKKFRKFLGSTVDLEKRYSSKCRCCNSICGYSCVKQKFKQVRKRKCVKTNLSEDAIADLWNVKRVWNTSHSVKSQDNELCVSYKQKNAGQFQEESANIEKLVQEETTSSSYVDAKNCFVQDACIQTVCQNRKETTGFSSRCIKEDEKISDLTKDTSFLFHKRGETEVEDKFEQTSLNCDCDLLSVVKSTKSVDLENLPCLEEGEKLNMNNKSSISNICTCVPHVPELQLERKCDCPPVFNYKYQYVEQPYKGNDVKTPPRLTKNQEVIPNECRKRRLFSVRNLWNSESISSSVCKCNQYTPNTLRSSTSTESMIYPATKTWLARIHRDQENITFMEKPGQIGEGPWSRKETTILKKTTNLLNHEIDNRENYNTGDDCNLLTCRCEDMRVKVISDDKFEDTETSRSRTSSSSTSLSSYDRDRSPRSFSRYINYRCRNLAHVPSSASTYTGSLTSEIEYECVKEAPKALNPLSLRSTITYGNHINDRFNMTKFSCQRTLSMMQRKSKEMYERTRNSSYD